MRPLVYLAGPFSQPVPTHNVAAAVRAARDLELCAGVAVFVPHLSALWDMIDPRPYDEWLAYDLEIIARCDALYRMDGTSAGADIEVKYARSIDIPTFTSTEQLAQWATARIGETT